MATKYYVDAEGNYIGGFVDIVDGNGKVLHRTSSVPDGAIEVATPPDHGLQKYDIENGLWLPLEIN